MSEMPSRGDRGYTNRHHRRCEICSSPGNLDFHHWDYSFDIGILICRDCHEFIHGGQGERVRDQQERREEHYGEDWICEAASRLVILDIKYHQEEYEFDDLIGLISPQYFDHIVRKYNLPNFHPSKYADVFNIPDWILSKDEWFHFAECHWLYEAVLYFETPESVTPPKEKLNIAQQVCDPDNGPTPDDLS